MGEWNQRYMTGGMCEVENENHSPFSILNSDYLTNLKREV